MESDSLLTTIFEFAVAVIFCVALVYFVDWICTPEIDREYDASRCVAAGYSKPYYSEGRVYCLDFGEEPRIMRLSQE